MTGSFCTAECSFLKFEALHDFFKDGKIFVEIMPSRRLIPDREVLFVLDESAVDDLVQKAAMLPIAQNRPERGDAADRDRLVLMNGHVGKIPTSHPLIE